jgi:hypothetical protein|tara:strand:+ start:652 stop:789 length:138 start_codon:yes stop_codon:yes gene_type:complete
MFNLNSKKMKNFNVATFLIGLATVYATIYVAGKAWEKSKENDDVV